MNIVDGEERWITFCASLKGSPDWKSFVKTMSWDNRALSNHLYADLPSLHSMPPL